MIRNSDDANMYYNLINQYVDEYIDKWKIKPTNLKSYLLGNKSKMVSFLERKGLKEIKSIDVILKDIIEDRVSIYSDSIMTFENYKTFESDEYKVIDIKQCLWKGIHKADTNHEKLLADMFDVSLSQINVVDAAKHIFQIDDIGPKDYCVVYSDSELDIIRENLKDYVFNKLSGQNLSLPGLDLEFGIGKFLNIDKYNSYVENLLSIDMVKSFICQQLNCDSKKKQFSNLDYFVGILK